MMQPTNHVVWHKMRPKTPEPEASCALDIMDQLRIECDPVSVGTTCVCELRV